MWPYARFQHFPRVLGERCPPACLPGHLPIYQPSLYGLDIMLCLVTGRHNETLLDFEDEEGDEDEQIEEKQRKGVDGVDDDIEEESTKKLESSGAALTQSVELMLGVQERFATVPNGPVADRVTAKLKAVLDKNPGFYVLKQVSNVLSRTDSKIPGEIRASKVPEYKYAPLTSVDVERSFSAYKQILTERRHDFKPENLEMVLVCHCFHSLSHSVQSP
ncbi:hypothetical protein HPB50_014584 [Hyalomma asiaticum]|uniref:Uncharacterized protein n=1 Tax=Hyalomma asiaticum TaxID=266040 RepID=A0ACB7RNJ4_HYAAI|nr:hypothetical protein HPB50_014584 [Hyalomma asiaticum]